MVKTKITKQGEVMKKGMIKLSLVAGSMLLGSTAAMAGGDIAPMEPMVDAGEPVKVSEWKSKMTLFGFSQIGVGFGDGVIKNNQEGDYKFSADRIRLGWKYVSGPLAAKVFLDFSKDGDDKGEIGVPDAVKDAFISYKFNKAVIIKSGVIKTPVGMGFTIPGWNLDVIKRGFDKKLAFERAFGVMVSGRDIGFDNNGKVNGLEMGHERPWKGFGYDIMIAGQTGRSGAVRNAGLGNANAYMGRVMFDWGQALHAEASYGVSESAGGIAGQVIGENPILGSEDYEVLNFGIDSHFDRANVKAEYYDTKNIRGVNGWDMNTLALTGTYYITDTLEGAVKYIGGTSTKKGVDVDASNTYIGLNYYINPKNNKMDRKSRRSRNRHRLQVNYVVAGGDTKNFAQVGSFFKEDAVLLQYQFAFKSSL
jgi:hypothetical protein